METENKDLLIQGAMSFGIHLDKKTVDAFDLYLRELLKWNQKINLTAVRSEKEIILKHFLDSLSAYPYLSNTASLIDIGSGAGFPGIPLKIVLPSCEVVLIDSVRKKVDFQRHIIRTLGLKGIKTVHGRVQEKEILQNMGGHFDAAISRAFSDLRTFLLLSHPLLKRGGVVLAMKGEKEEEDISPHSETAQTQYRLQKRVSFPLPFSDYKRAIFLFEKG
jgi:16S rRNA (guanine527-N7)-methyltransferase